MAFGSQKILALKKIGESNDELGKYIETQYAQEQNTCLPLEVKDPQTYELL